uniref:Putative secreted protein n=1 Tax=Ixodes ricinus TaxID=34613 RepID=A0A6B0U7B9_IXORI
MTQPALSMGKFFLTGATLVRFLACVDSFVNHQRMRSGKRLLANLATKRFHPHVSPHVSPVDTTFSKLSLADRAAERLLSCVCPFVLDDMM